MNLAIAPVEERGTYGIGILLLAQLALVTIDPSAKWLAAGGMPLAEIIFVRYAVHLAMVLVVALPAHRLALFRTRAFGLEMARGGALVLSTLTNFLAVKFLPVTMTSAILNTTPLLICMLSVPLLGEHVDWRRWLAIIVGLVGVLIIIRPGTSHFSSAVFLSLAGALLGAFYNILTRKLAGIDSASTQQVYASTLAVVCSAPFAFGGWVWPHSGVSWFAFGLIGVTGMVGHQLATIAARFAPASVLAPFSYLQIIYASIISWLVFSQPPTVWIYVGATIIILSGVYMALRERQLRKPVTLAILED
jgi:drug/metabolite transporter (DMT)-like permease